MLQQHHHLSEQPMELPPGFRFHPTDEELITHYLARKVSDADFAACAIGDADLNKCEPWDLPLRAKMGEKEWYFFCLKDRKYPTGLRTNRATQSGYWKATGKDKEIYRGKHLVGMKKTLVFYGGRAPKGEKTNWVMHEFRLDGNYSAYALPKASKNNEWAICRVFKKSAGGNKAVGMVRVVGSSAAGDHQLGSSLLPPLMDVPAACKSDRGSSFASAAVPGAAHVTCFSSAMEGQRDQEEAMAQFLNPSYLSSSPANQDDGLVSSAPFHLGEGVSLVQLLEGNGYGALMAHSCKGERERLSASQDTGLTSDMNPEISSSSGPLQLDDALWSY